MEKTTFDKIRNIVYEQSGISLGENKEALVCARIGKRMRSLGMDDFKDYMHHLDNDESGSELIQLLDVISTNVTHFYRESKHFEILEDLLHQWVDEGQQRFRIWSAASSTGEEPYTIAMTMYEVLGDSYDAKILATDISTRVLQKAKEGIYEPRHIEKIPRNMLHKYFIKRKSENGESYEVKQILKDVLRFTRLNLSVTPYPLRGPLDIIFCRNVMIYFDNNMRRKVLEDMYRLLKPGGYLMVGHAESLTGLVSRFKSVMPSIYIKDQ